MIEVKNFSKRYGKFVAVKNMNLTAYDGVLTILLGPNGAGKSTTIKSITGLLKYDGEILIDKYPNKSLEAKKVFGYVPELPSSYDLLTIDEHLTFIEKAYQLENVSELKESLLKRFDLVDKRNKIAKELSKGMAQKLSLCCALLIQPHTLIIDEPMIGLDPEGIEQVLDVIKEYKANGHCILMSTHIIDMVESLWDEAYIMDEGEIKRYVKRSELSETETLKSIFFEVTHHE